MNINPDQITHIAHLARLGIDKQDLPDYSEDLSKILALVEQINNVDTQNVPPLAHPLDINQRLRPDEITEENNRDDLLKIAPATEAGLFLVPQVIE